MKPLAGWAVIGALVAAAAPARAGDVKMSFENGLVTVVATSASPREILGEWARLGQVRVTNLERLSGAPVTLQITDLPEARALEIILRGTAGYVAAPRRVTAATESQYDRILLLPGVAPPVSALSHAAPNAAMGRGGFGGPGAGGFGASVFGRRGSMPAGQATESFVMPEPVAGEEEGGQPAMPATVVPGGQAGAAQNAPASPLGAARPGETVGPDILSIRARYGPGAQVPATSGQGVSPYGLPTPPVTAPGQATSGPIKVPN